MLLAMKSHKVLLSQDPCLYISRFAHALEFGDKTHEVSMTAMRLTQRMKRDWMSTGRRPSGLCGAALLVAARIHDFSRSVKEVIKVVKVCHATLKKRLIEFEETPSSQLTIEEFQTIDLEEEQDPPCFTEGKRRAKKLQEQSKLPDMTEEVSKLQKEIEKTLAEQKPRGPWAAYAKMADDSTSVDSDVSRLSDVFDGESSVDSGRTSSIDSSPLIHHSKTDMKHVDYSPCKNDIGELSWNSKEEKVTLSNTSSNEDERDLFKTKQLKNDEITQELVIGSNVLDSLEIGSLKKDKAGVACLKLAVQDIVSDCIGEDGENSRCATDEGNEELDLTGIDDDELDYFLLSEKEVLVKTKIWMTENEDYLEEQRIKEEKRRKEEEEEAKKPPEKRKKKHVRKKRTPMPEAATPQEAIQRILQEKRISCKINYDVLNDLNVKSATIKTDMVKPTSSFLQDIDNIKPVSRIRSSVSFDLSHEKQPPSKKLKTEKQELPPMLPQAKEEREPEVVVESGPVQYEQKDDGYGDEEDADGYDDDEEHHLSAAQLLGHTVSMEDEYGYDMD
ncbi:hypothetical protein DPMN_096710 [Dreissena polymorpha]|uniref:Cyclin-like domain-containing protein n=1 Tax=Dreissena polymorpha TaxID=45954 RepID=A0A9D4LBW3_DREPO|nr:hypothetical protein DPMN_096710 [Dreissena polymorpha]